MHNRLRERLNEIGITQKELAERLQVTPITINKFLRLKALKLETYEKIANALNIPAWTLFLDDDEIAAIRAGEQTSSDPDSNITEVTSKCPYCNRNITVKVGITK